MNIKGEKNRKGLNRFGGKNLRDAYKELFLKEKYAREKQIKHMCIESGK